MTEIIYRSYCGKENKSTKKWCKKYFKKLYPKDHLFIDYIKSKWSGNFSDSVFSSFKKFVQTHLYGFIMTCSILVTATTVVVNVVNNKVKFEVVTERPTEVLMYRGEVV